MQQIPVYADSLTWGIVPGTRQRLPFTERWPGVMEEALRARGVDAGDHRRLAAPGGAAAAPAAAAGLPNPALSTLRQRGVNHVCLTTDDLDGELARLRAAGVTPRNAVMIFHDRKLVFLDGPESVVVELAEWR